MPEINFGQKTIPYTVRHSQRAQTAKLRITAEKGLEVVLPFRLPADAIEEFLQSNEKWILKHIDRPEYTPPPPRRFVTGETLLFLGNEFRLEVATVTDEEEAVEWEPGHVLVTVSDLLPPAERPTRVRRLLESWYRHQALDCFVERTRDISKQLGLQVHWVRVRDQKTRWGSCSSRGNINYNWRLIMAPPQVIDYVVVHELCHLKIPNHSAAFWRMVGASVPWYPDCVRWLRENGHTLYL